MKKSILFFGLLVASLTACSSDDAQPQTTLPSTYRVEISHDGNTQSFGQLLSVNLEVNELQPIELKSNFEFDNKEEGTYLTPQLYSLSYSGEVKDIYFETISPINGIALVHMFGSKTDETLNATVKIYKNGSLIKKQTTAINKENWEYNLSVR